MAAFAADAVGKAEAPARAANSLVLHRVAVEAKLLLVGMGLGTVEVVRDTFGAVIIEDLESAGVLVERGRATGVEFRRRGKTILLTTHFMEEAERLCDRLCVIEEGRKVAEGKPDDLIQRVIGCDVEAARCEEARVAGIEIANGAAAVAEAASDIITSLPTPKAVLDTARTIARAKAKGRTVIETSTLALADKGEAQRILAEAGHTALDCPISGTGAQAKVKDLVRARIPMAADGSITLTCRAWAARGRRLA